MGDPNAMHKYLGNHHTTNANGVRWKAFLDAIDTTVLTGETYLYMSNIYCPNLFLSGLC